jgi:hypothetical protein
MVSGMAATKMTITLHDGQIEAIRALVAAGQAANISAFVAATEHARVGMRRTRYDVNASRTTPGPAVE